LFLYLEKSTKKVMDYFVFEPNSIFTRSRIVNTLTPLFERVKAAEGIYDYIIICDERNNIPEVIDNNELIVDIYIKPTRAAEFITVNFIATRTDTNFEELVG
jgi:phage tail sheath protein FI